MTHAATRGGPNDRLGDKGTVLRAGAGGLGVRILSLFATLLSFVVLTRVQGDTGYGLYVFALSVTALLALPVQVRMPTLAIRETASAESANDWGALHRIRDWAVRVNVHFGLAIAGAIPLFTWVGGARLSYDSRHVFWLAAALILPVAQTSTFGATLRGLRWVVSGLYPGEVLRPLLISALVAATLLLWVDGPSPEIALVLNFIATMLVLLLLIVPVRGVLTAQSRAERGRRVTPRSRKSALASGMSMRTEGSDGTVHPNHLRGPRRSRDHAHQHELQHEAMALA